MQTVILGGAVLLVLWQFIRGWQLGIVRQIANIFGLAAAGVAGYFGGPLAAPLLAPTGLPEQSQALLAGGVAALLIFAVISGASAIIFRSTAQQPLRIVRWIYGLGGAVVGAAFGLGIVWLGVVGLRADSDLAEMLRNFRVREAAEEIANRR